ncbi:MAG: response regulator transcription factor [Deltaproteobacteria bacterium]|nr:response regulator transcription factor [Deltaproteobacteria bacterium]
MQPITILVADDDPNLREVVRYALSREGFSVIEANNGVEALTLALARAPDLVVLDVLMPELDGLEVCRRLRRDRESLPILFLSSRDEELDRVVGLEIGGDDYVTKPFSPRELVSRVKALLRRSRATSLPATLTPPVASVAPVASIAPVAPVAPVASSDELRVGLLRLRPSEHRVYAGDHEVELTVTEFRILQALMSRPGRVFTRDELTERAYDGPHHISDRTLDSHIRRVRQKLRERDVDPIETVHGLGFRLSAAP